MGIIPPHCPMHPRTYSSFFNDARTLEPVAPYKLETVNHPRNGHPVQRLEYNNFYSDYKKDALQWYSPSTTQNWDNTHANTTTLPSPLPAANGQDKSLELYEETRHKNQFAVPLPTNGTNQIGVLFNDKCQVPTFRYKRYASQPVNNKEWFYNKLYLEDVTEETQNQKAQYMDDRMQNNMAIYSSVFEDMYILQLNPIDKDKLDHIRKTY